MKPQLVKAREAVTVKAGPAKKTSRKVKRTGVKTRRYND
jgi:hypothetical protein